jgi:hypothetical protein
MNYSSELKKFLTSQYIYSGARIALAIVIPSIILAQFGLAKRIFPFSSRDKFRRTYRSARPFIRRRNTLVLSVITFSLIALIASLVKVFPVAVYLEIIVFGFFFLDDWCLWLQAGDIWFTIPCGPELYRRASYR